MDMESQDTNNVIWSNIIGISLSLATMIPFIQATSIYWQVFLLELEATPLVISIMFSVSSIISSISMIYGGYLADRYGRKKLIVMFTFFMSLTFLAMYYAASWREIFIIYALQGLASIYSPALDAIIADSAPVQKRGKMYSIIFLFPRIMVIIAPYIALLFIKKYGLVYGVRRLMILAFITCMLASLIRAISLRETLEIKKKEMILSSNAEYGYREVLGYIVKNMTRLLIFVGILMFMFGMIYLQQLYVLVYLQVDYETWAYINMIYIAISIMLTIPSDIIVDKIGRKTPLIISMALAIICQAILAFAPINKAGLYVTISFILSAFANFLGFTAYISIEADLLPHEQRGRAYAVLRIFESATSILGVIVDGILYVLHPRLPFIGATILSILGFIISTILKETLPRELNSPSLNVQS